MVFRSTNSTACSVQNKAGTTLKLTSPSSSSQRFPSASFSTSTMPQVNNSISSDTQSETRNVCSKSASTTSPQTGSIAMPNNCEYADALYAMSYLSPLPLDAPESPPKPGTPIKDARVAIGPLLEDISAYESASGGKIKFNSKRVLLKSLEEEISTYQSQNNRKLRLPPSISYQQTVKKQTGRKRKKKSDADVDEKRVPQMEGAYQDVKSSLIDTTLLLSQKLKSSQNVSQIESSMTVLKDRIVSEIQSQESEQISDGEPTECVLQEIGKETEDVKEDEMASEKVYSSCSMTEEDDTKIIADSQCKNMTNETKKDEDDIKDEAPISDAELNFSSQTPNNLQMSQIPPPSSDDSSGNCERLSESIFEIKSSHSTTVNPSRASSSLIYSTNHCDSSNSTWDGDNSDVLHGNDETDRPETPPTPLIECPEIPPQVLNPATAYTTATDGPSLERVTSTMSIYDIPSKDNCKAFWGDANDLPSIIKSKDIRRQSVLIGSNLICHLPEFGTTSQQVGVS